jgi:hypothetical protein
MSIWLEGGLLRPRGFCLFRHILLQQILGGLRLNYTCVKFSLFPPNAMETVLVSMAYFGNLHDCHLGRSSNSRRTIGTYKWHRSVRDRDLRANRLFWYKIDHIIFNPLRSSGFITHRIRGMSSAIGSGSSHQRQFQQNDIVSEVIKRTTLKGKYLQ